jgi:hypothetical protein
MADYAHVEWVDSPTFDRETQRLSQKTPENRNGQWFMAWEVTQIPEPEMSEKVRDKRNKLLAESDWTQLSDSPADRAAWAAYRQTLRDISAQAGFPWEVTWPAKPE